MHGKRMGYVEGSRSPADIDVIGIVDRRQKAIAAQTRGIYDARSLANGIGCLERERLAEAVQNRSSETIVLRPSAIVPVKDGVKKRIRPNSHASGGIKAPDADITVRANVLVDA